MPSRDRKQQVIDLLKAGETGAAAIAAVLLAVMCASSASAGRVRKHPKSSSSEYCFPTPSAARRDTSPKTKRGRPAPGRRRLAGYTPR